jgi:hypothetical protein
MSIKGPSYSTDPLTKILLLCGIVAGPVFTIAWILLGATRANYDPLRHPISSLAIDEFGWIQSANFFVTDPMNGYPPGTPAFPVQYTLAGRSILC